MLRRQWWSLGWKRRKLYITYIVANQQRYQWISISHMIYIAYYQPRKSIWIKTLEHFHKKKHNVHVTSIHSTRQNEHHLHYERRMPTRTITYYLFIKCYLMHFLLLTPSVQTNSTLPDRSIIIIKYIHDDIFHWHLYPRFHFFIKIGI